jgi:hypothetical protein
LWYPDIVSAKNLPFEKYRYCKPDYFQAKNRMCRDEIKKLSAQKCRDPQIISQPKWVNPECICIISAKIDSWQSGKITLSKDGASNYYNVAIYISLLTAYSSLVYKKTIHISI